jgi:ABC-type uncharacterized transport system permease subunit
MNYSNLTDASFQHPQEPQESSIYFALFVLVALAFLCCWPNLMRMGLNRLGENVKQQQLLK